MLLRSGLPPFLNRCKDTAKNRSVQENREKSTQILRKLVSLSICKYVASYGAQRHAEENATLR